MVGPGTGKILKGDVLPQKGGGAQERDKGERKLTFLFMSLSFLGTPHKHFPFATLHGAN